MGKPYAELRSQLLQLEANASAIRLDLELDPASINRHAHSLAQTARLPLPMSRSLVLQAVGLERLDGAGNVSLHDTSSD
ncbi:MAG: hypothetical protein ACE37F_14565 [Nannocystaceae bacterium]|nr:hypothetical protein [bacterium]